MYCVLQRPLFRYNFYSFCLIQSFLLPVYRWVATPSQSTQTQLTWWRSGLQIAWVSYDFFQCVRHVQPAVMFFFLLAKIRTKVGKPSLNEAFIYTRNQSQFFALLNLIVTKQYKYYEVINQQRVKITCCSIKQQLQKKESRLVKSSKQHIR